jgi:hypothetical protein
MMTRHVENPETRKPGRRETAEQVQEYAKGEIRARHGRINGWLLVVYLVLFVWSLWYAYAYWGGLGPGLDY